MTSTRNRSSGRPRIDPERWREIAPAVGILTLVLGIVVVTAILQAEGESADRGVLRELPPDHGRDVVRDAALAGPAAAEGDETIVDDPRPTRDATRTSPPPVRHAAGPEQRAHDDLARLSTRRDGLTLQLGLICDETNVRQRLAELGDETDLYFLPADRSGRPCYRVCWGTFATRDEAESAVLPERVRAVFAERPVIQDVSLVAP